MENLHLGELALGEMPLPPPTKIIYDVIKGTAIHVFTFLGNKDDYGVGTTQHQQQQTAIPRCPIIMVRYIQGLSRLRQTQWVNFSNHHGATSPDNWDEVSNEKILPRRVLHYSMDTYRTIATIPNRKRHQPAEVYPTQYCEVT
ncbi:hypothetical protein CHS0354_000031 [Potamilus streckersoni]|uniref:Uncharacterized protein n=1 Tax=Potamilus streckersoni TaxID=2493646 RepID=A0AAE0RLZ2_9BIVA|nr:hypothetical protein CHS0354_000031 [Potamilus streckersoni]